MPIGGSGEKSVGAGYTLFVSMAATAGGGWQPTPGIVSMAA
jgi:hypothetical protein